MTTISRFVATLFAPVVFVLLSGCLPYDPEDTEPVTSLVQGCYFSNTGKVMEIKDSVIFHADGEKFADIVGSSYARRWNKIRTGVSVTVDRRSGVLLRGRKVTSAGLLFRESEGSIVFDIPTSDDGAFLALERGPC